MGNTTKMSARARIDALVDANSFVEIGAMITKRATDFNMDEKEVPADGVITGYGVIGDNLVFVYSQDASAMNGSSRTSPSTVLVISTPAPPINAPEPPVASERASALFCCALTDTLPP